MAAIDEVSEMVSPSSGQEAGPRLRSRTAQSRRSEVGPCTRSGSMWFLPGNTGKDRLRQGGVSRPGHQTALTVVEPC